MTGASTPVRRSRRAPGSDHRPPPILVHDVFTPGKANPAFQKLFSPSALPNQRDPPSPSSWGGGGGASGMRNRDAASARPVNGLTPQHAKGLARHARTASASVPLTPSESTMDLDSDVNCLDLGNQTGSDALWFRQVCQLQRRQARERDGLTSPGPSEKGKQRAEDAMERLKGAGVAAPGFGTSPSPRRRRVASDSSSTAAVASTSAATGVNNMEEEIRRDKDGASKTWRGTKTRRGLAPPIKEEAAFLHALSKRATPEEVASLLASFRAEASRVASVLAASNSAVLAAATQGNPVFATLVPNVQSAFESAAAAVQSRASAASVAATATAAPSNTDGQSSQQTSATSRNPQASGTAAPSSSNNSNLVKTVVPAVVVPVVVGILIAVFCVYCMRKRRKEREPMTPASFGEGIPPISAPRSMGATPASYGSRAHGSPSNYVGASPNTRNTTSPRGDNESSQSSNASHSAVGLAYGGSGDEPRTRWGRRSLLDVMASAAGVLGTRNARAQSGSSSFGGDQEHPEQFIDDSEVPVPYIGRAPSVVSRASEDRGVGGYNSVTGYQPGMPRPVGHGYHYDQFSRNTTPSRTETPQSAIPMPSTGGLTTIASSNRESGASEWTNMTEESPESEMTEVVGSHHSVAHAGAHDSMSLPYDTRAAEATTSRVDTTASADDVFYTDQGSMATFSDSGGTQTQDVDFGSSSGNSDDSDQNTPRVGDEGLGGLTPTRPLRGGPESHRLNDGSWW